MEGHLLNVSNHKYKYACVQHCILFPCMAIVLLLAVITCKQNGFPSNYDNYSIITIYGVNSDISVTMNVRLACIIPQCFLYKLTFTFETVFILVLFS